MKQLALFFVGTWLGMVPAPVRAAEPAHNVFTQTKAAFQELDVLLGNPPGSPIERARILLAAGRLEDALRLAPVLEEESSAASRWMALQVRLAVHDYGPAAGLAAGIDPATRDPDLRRALYAWRFETEDLESVKNLVDAGLEADAMSVEDLISGARLALALLDADRAETYLLRAETAVENADGRSRIAAARSAVAHRRRDWDAALAHALDALTEDPLAPDHLAALGDILVRLGRTDEAVTAYTWAVRVDPLHEGAHYSLGNGYARLNYTQLQVAYPGAFVGASTRPLLENADLVYQNGYTDMAMGAYQGLYQAQSGLADVAVRLGSVHFARGEYPQAKRYFVESLRACPEYGRAHNGLAKVLEAERIRVDVHRAGYEAAFESAPFPDLPECVDQVVSQWKMLSDRHRKRVALSLAPWSRYLPVLAEGGATYYIKNIHELLSQSPGQETLRDQRISYDSRLWDDVRGCGGYHTVTGIEDVERSIYNGYDTVLHELSHQVHAVLTPERKRQIQELYIRAKERDRANGDAFLSRYAGGSVWEYFAEGANALFHPRRDGFDTREMLRERLEERDPDLLRLVREIMDAADIDSCYAVALANQGDDRLQNGNPGEAMASYRRALERSPEDETTIGALIHAHLAAGETDPAVDWAGRAAILHPQSGSLAVRRAQAFWFAGYGLDTAIGILEDAATAVREADRYEVQLSLGSLYWTRGDAAKAREVFTQVLAYQNDNPEALWGLAAAAGLAGDFDEARIRYGEAVRLRTGVAELRAAFAWDLLRAADPDAAREQVDAGLLLEPDSPDLLALDAWLVLNAGEIESAWTKATGAVAAGAWSDLAQVVKYKTQLAMGKSVAAEETIAPLRERVRSEAPPEFVFLSKRGEYRITHELPAVIRELIDAE